eukprot:TRINITY_DN58809_c0_g1_i1.p1 TRINITY_DN58809_c0_g1~~TRINITY_DN58809_c0_g1_i1.p1  ORF type:complete len:204 (-),score=22.52 TRINITY_DN58809_c0_g1_i1:32-643(-)
MVLELLVRRVATSSVAGFPKAPCSKGFGQLVSGAATASPKSCHAGRRNVAGRALVAASASTGVTTSSTFSLVSKPNRLCLTGWRAGGRSFSNWWKKYVDGRNPDQPHGVIVAGFLREEGIDPYLMSRAEIERMRQYYLTEFRYLHVRMREKDPKVTEAQVDAMPEHERRSMALECVRQYRTKLIEQFRESYPYSPPSSSSERA